MDVQFDSGLRAKMTAKPPIIAELDLAAMGNPSRQFDWSAVRDGYEPGDCMGRGATKLDAIADLLFQEQFK